MKVVLQAIDGKEVAFTEKTEKLGEDKSVDVVTTISVSIGKELRDINVREFAKMLHAFSDYSDGEDTWGE